LLKAAGREKKVRKVKVKEEELAPYRASYEVNDCSRSCGYLLSMMIRSLWED